MTEGGTPAPCATSMNHTHHQPQYAGPCMHPHQQSHGRPTITQQLSNTTRSVPWLAFSQPQSNPVSDPTTSTSYGTNLAQKGLIQWRTYPPWLTSITPSSHSCSSSRTKEAKEEGHQDGPERLLVGSLCVLFFLEWKSSIAPFEPAWILSRLSFHSRNSKSNILNIHSPLYPS